MRKYFIVVSAIFCALLIASAMCIARPVHVEEAARPLPLLVTARDTVVAAGRVFPSARPVDSSLWWVTDGGYNIWIKEAFGAGGVVHEVVSATLAQRSYGPQTHKLVQNIDALMLQNGYRRSPQNTSESLEGNAFGDYTAGYTRDGTVCVFSIDGDSSLDTRVAMKCSEHLEKFMSEQIPYLRALPDKDAAVFDVTRSSGKFAVVSVRHRRGGYRAILKNTLRGFVLVYAGQEPPSCDIVEKQRIPLDIADGCYEKDGTTLRTLR